MISRSRTVSLHHETVFLSLSNPSGGAGLGSPAISVLTITEDDPVPPAGSLQFSDASYQVNEKRTTAVITVVRVGGSFGTVGVDYVSNDGSATAGSDYMAVSGNLSFTDGVTSRNFKIELLGDAIYEGDETLNLTLSHPAGGAGLGSPSTVSLTIIEDDARSETVVADGGGGGGIDLMTLGLLLSLYLRNFVKSKRFNRT